MTDVDEQGGRPSPSGGARRRQNVSMALAAIFGVTVVVVVLLVTLRAGDDTDAVVVSTTALPVLGDPAAPRESIPEGDYDAFCAASIEQAVDFDPDAGLEGLRTLLREVDLDQLIAVAPEGLRPALTTVRDQREQVVATLEQVDDVGQLGPADFPDGFVDATVLIADASAVHCGDG